MKIIILFVSVVTLLPSLLIAKEWKVEEMKIPLSSSCVLEESEVIASLRAGCGARDVECAQEILRQSNNDRSVYIISSWDSFVEFREKFCQAPFLSKISKDFFKENNMCIVPVTYTGSRFIKNERVYGAEDKCGFAYEVWDRELEAIPACLWKTLYVVKIKRSTL